MEKSAGRHAVGQNISCVVKSSYYGMTTNSLTTYVRFYVYDVLFI